MFSSTRYFGIIIYHSSGLPEDLCASRLDALACELRCEKRARIVCSPDEKIDMRWIESGVVESCAKKLTDPCANLNEKKTRLFEYFDDSMIFP